MARPGRAGLLASALFVLLAALAPALLPAPARGENLERQRDRYLEAESALRRGQLSRFEQLKQKLFEYPLYGYLDFAYLRKYRKKATAEQLREFFRLYNGQPIATRMRTAWLQELARRRDWETFLDFYWPQTSTRLRCHEIHARLKLGREPEQALEDALELWMVGHSQPDACTPVFKALYAASVLSADHIWQRIRLAFAAGKPSLARYLARQLSGGDRRWVERWYQAHRRPTAALTSNWAQHDSPLVREILAHALIRLARHKPAQAAQHLQRLEKTHRFTPGRRGEVLRRIALSAVLSDDPQADALLARAPDDGQDHDLAQWRVRHALRRQDTAAVLDTIGQLAPALRGQDEWRYWEAWALDRQGQRGRAMQIYGELAEKRSYYGFLAADRLQRDYAMNDRPTPARRDELRQLASWPAFRRAHELYLLGRRTDARREWYAATRQMEQRQLELAAVLAHRWGWHDRAIITAAEARHWDDLALRFPLAHRDTILAAAARYRLDPALIYGVIRQESAFMEDAHSAVGALGLMQLMPATGRQTARALNIRYGGNRALLHSSHNIQLGSAYLNHLLTRYKGSPVLAAAAYNAGPHRVSRWLPRKQAVPAALWTENIPFRETRHYVKQVLTYATIFDWRLSRTITRLSSRLSDIRPRD